MSGRYVRSALIYSGFPNIITLLSVKVVHFNHCYIFVFPDLCLDKQTNLSAQLFILAQHVSTIRPWSRAAFYWTEFTFTSHEVKVNFVSKLDINQKKTSPQAKRHKSSLHVISLHFFSLLWLFSLLWQFNFFDYFRFLDYYYFHLFEYLHFFEYFHLFKNFQFFDFVTSFTIPTSSQQHFFSFNTITKIWSPGGATCNSWKFGHQVTPLASVENFANMWHHLYYF